MKRMHHPPQRMALWLVWAAARLTTTTTTEAFSFVSRTSTNARPSTLAWLGTKRKPTKLYQQQQSSSDSNPEPIFYDDFGETPDAQVFYQAPTSTTTAPTTLAAPSSKSSDSLDWRTFRRNLVQQQQQATTTTTTTTESSTSTDNNNKNRDILESQNEQLAQEYKKDVWAHEIPTPEVGGLVVRLPLEVELLRNYKHCLSGRRLRQEFNDDNSDTNIETWYERAQDFIERNMLELAQSAATSATDDDDEEDGQLDVSRLPEDHADMLQLFLDHQETWQEVCLVVEEDTQTRTTTCLVLNRPMALQLTDSLAHLVLYGSSPPRSIKGVDKDEFMKAFGPECAIYVGGPDQQHLPSLLLHGIADLPGATCIAPGLYQGGLPAAIRGVLNGTYQPLEFRFFVGRHKYGPPGTSNGNNNNNTYLPVQVALGKFQPVACARSLALKQCIQLPKPLWHEVLELCGGELAEISKLEMFKRDDLRFQIVDDDDDDDDDEYEALDVVLLGDDDIPDELDELFDDDDDEEEEDEDDDGDDDVSSYYRGRL